MFPKSGETEGHLACNHDNIRQYYKAFPEALFDASSLFQVQMEYWNCLDCFLVMELPQLKRENPRQLN
jgi:hypothetical protein